MFDEKALVFLYALTPAHPGSGQTVGAVDLPVQREAHTDLPMIQASGVKGAWRDHAERTWSSASEHVMDAFGPPTERAHEHAGALAFTDARLLAFPVRSVLGLLAWCTSPFVWNRFRRDAELVGLQVPVAPAVQNDRALASGGACIRDGEMVLEAYAFDAEVDQAATACAEALVESGAIEPSMESSFRERLVFVEDDVLRDLTRHGAEVVARIALGEAGTTAEGALWYEELIPAETLFFLLALATDARAERNGQRRSASDILDLVRLDDTQVVQIGGEATVGRGLFRVKVR